MKLIGTTSAAAFLAAILAAATSFSADWYTIDVGAKTMANDVLEIRHGKPSGGYWGNGINRFFVKSENKSYGHTIDAFGCGYAKYDKTGPSTYEISKETDNMIEVLVKYTDCVSVEKHERLYKGIDIFEIAYTKLNTLWYEDFWDIGDRFTMYGIDKSISRSEYSGTYACKDQNFGDCFIGKLGSTEDKCTYKNHLIFGSFENASGKGIGEVYPTSLGIHDWKVWWYDRSIANYEVFPNNKGASTRWIFPFTGGKEGMEEKGKKICDCAESGKTLAECFSGSPVVAKSNAVRQSTPALRACVRSGVLYAHLPSGTSGMLEVLDASGKIAAREEVSGSAEFCFSLKNVSRGVYVVSLQSGTQKTAVRVVNRAGL